MNEQGHFEVHDHFEVYSTACKFSNLAFAYSILLKFIMIFAERCQPITAENGDKTFGSDNYSVSALFFTRIKCKCKLK